MNKERAEKLLKRVSEQLEIQPNDKYLLMKKEELENQVQGETESEKPADDSGIA